MIEQNFIKIYEHNFKKNWSLPALTDYGENNTITYGELAKEIAKLHLLFEQIGIKRGDKIALVSKNHSRWCITFMATITYGAVIVPILHEFNPQSIEYIVKHSDAKALFIHANILKNFETSPFEIPLFDIPTFKQVTYQNGTFSTSATEADKLFKQRYGDHFTKEHVIYPEVSNQEVACINYTSGTTGFSKGVMLTANNFAGNVTYAKQLNLMLRGEPHLAFLPMAHVYGCAFDFLYPLSNGVHITLLGVMPTPRNLIKAMKEIRPRLIITVPLIFEKIYKRKILPVIERPIMKWLLRIPAINTLIYKRIRNSLYNSLGGQFREVIIGGAALNKDVEAFFHKIKFPFTVGYGMTECAPLISYDYARDFVPTSCGSVLKGIMEARIDSDAPANIPGEIQVRGENMMIGYYKNPKATEEAFTADGWLKTGDSGIMKGQRLFIKGRIKTMLLSANGQNIYPEEIESRLNNLPYVAESLVIKRERGLIALVYPDHMAMETDKISTKDLSDIMSSNRDRLNSSVANYEKISAIEIMQEEFEKTPKKSIKRFLYQ